MQIEILAAVFDYFFDVFVRLILQKVGVDGFTGSRRESDVRYKFHFETIL